MTSTGLPANLHDHNSPFHVHRHLSLRGAQNQFDIVDKIDVHVRPMRQRKLKPKHAKKNKVDTQLVGPGFNLLRPTRGRGFPGKFEFPFC